MAAVVNVLRPELLVFGGDLAGAGDTLLDAVRAAIERSAVAPAAPRRPRDRRHAAGPGDLAGAHAELISVKRVSHTALDSRPA